MYAGKIPFDQHGNPVPFIQRRVEYYVWEDNATFHTSLDFVRFERGRSAAHAIYAKADDPTWEVTMFLSDLEDVVIRGLAPLRLTGTFEYVKRGQNYGVKLALIEGRP
jgi:hypothetical protein